MENTKAEAIITGAINHLCATSRAFVGTQQRDDLVESVDILRAARTRAIELSSPSTEQSLGYRVFALVYQGGIANVFECRTGNAGTWGREAKRIKQGTFRECEDFARGIIAGSNKNLVFSAACNMAGDIANQNWNDKLSDAPFSEQFAPVFHGYKRID